MAYHRASCFALKKNKFDNQVAPTGIEPVFHA